MGVPLAALSEFSGLVGATGSKTAFTYLAVGSGTTAFAEAQTTLVTELTDSGLARAAATVSQITTTHANDTLNLTKTWTASGSKTVAELGAFNASSGGTMASRTVLTSARSVVSGDSYTGTVKVIFAH